MSDDHACDQLPAPVLVTSSSYDSLASYYMNDDHVCDQLPAPV
jgi:hypothetical protein